MKAILLVAAMPFIAEKGSSLRTLEMVQLLSKKYKVDVLCYSMGKEYEIPNVTIYRTASWFTPKSGIGKPTFSKLFLDILLLWSGVSLIFKKKYIHLQGEDFEGRFIVQILTLFCKKPKIIYNFHNRVRENLIANVKQNSLWLKILPKIEKWLISNSDLIILNWKSLLEDSIFEKKNTVVYRDRLPKGQTKTQLPTKEYILYSGNFKEYQGMEEFLYSFQKIKNKIPLVLIGKPTSNVLQAIKKLDLKKKHLSFGHSPCKRNKLYHGSCTILSVSDKNSSKKHENNSLYYKRQTNIGKQQW
jgi:glycosyltransferase involved in cell wall biosynthesis